jgi:hypothetical protein
VQCILWVSVHWQSKMAKKWFCFWNTITNSVSRSEWRNKCPTFWGRKINGERKEEEIRKEREEEMRNEALRFCRQVWKFWKTEYSNCFFKLQPHTLAFPKVGASPIPPPPEAIKHSFSSVTEKFASTK